MHVYGLVNYEAPVAITCNWVNHKSPVARYGSIFASEIVRALHCLVKTPLIVHPQLHVRLRRLAREDGHCYRQPAIWLIPGRFSCYGPCKE